MSEYVQVSFDEAFKLKNKLKFILLRYGHVPNEIFLYSFVTLRSFNKETRKIEMDEYYLSYSDKQISLFAIKKDYLSIKNKEEFNILDYV